LPGGLARLGAGALGGGGPKPRSESLWDCRRALVGSSCSASSSSSALFLRLGTAAGRRNT